MQGVDVILSGNSSDKYVLVCHLPAIYCRGILSHQAIQPTCTAAGVLIRDMLLISTLPGSNPTA